MYNEFLLLITTYYFLNFAENILHKLAHSRKYGNILYRWHKYHHIIEFPPNELTKDIYPSTHKYENIFIYFAIVWWIFMYQYLEFYYFKILLSESILYMICIDRLHTYYHLNNSILERFKWFRKKKELHLLHHKKTYLNFNLYDFTSDILLQTYR